MVVNLFFYPPTPLSRCPSVSPSPYFFFNLISNNFGQFLPVT
jgi:hypothetical protein